MTDNGCRPFYIDTSEIGFVLKRLFLYSQVLKQLLDMDDDEDYNIRRLRIRTKPSNNNPNSGGFASHHVPVSVPLPPPPPPRVIARRPVVTAASQDMFGRPSGHGNNNNHHPKVIAISDHQPAKIYSMSKDGGGHNNAIRISDHQPAKVFSLTKDGSGNPHVMYSSEGFSLAGRNPESDQQQSSMGFHHVKAYKIRPGMYHPQGSNGEKIQFSEASLSPFSTQDGSEPGTRPVLRPMKNSDKRIVEDADLIAIEKSEDGEIHAFKVETVTTDSSEDDSKMNFSYHPILEYLNM